MFITNSQNQITLYDKSQSVKPKFNNITLKKLSVDEFYDKLKKSGEEDSNDIGIISYIAKLEATTNTTHIDRLLGGSVRSREERLSGAYIRSNNSSFGNYGLSHILKDGGASPATINLGEGIKGNIIFDLNGNNQIDTVHENLTEKNLFALDDNRDGLIDSNDEYFNKLQVVIQDENSEYKMVKLSSIVSFINLEDYLDTEKIDYYENTRGENIFLNKYITPEYTHEKVTNEELNEIFDTYADENGWVNLDGEEDLRKLFMNLAYEKKDVNGNSYLQKFNSEYIQSLSIDDARFELGKAFTDGIDMKDGTTYQALMEVQKDRFLDIYEAHKTYGSTIDLKREFERITNLEFSEENLEKVKSLVDSGDFLSAFKDMDTIVAMKKNSNGTFTLKFDTGREIDVNGLFRNSGDFLTLDGNENKRISILDKNEIEELDTNSDNKIDSSEIDFETLAVKMDSKVKTLQDAGVESINIYKENEEIIFELQFKSGEKKESKELYRVTDLTKRDKFESIEQLKEIVNNPYQTKVSDEKNTLYFA